MVRQSAASDSTREVTGGEIIRESDYSGSGVSRGLGNRITLGQGSGEAGRLRPVIDRRYPLERAADAYRYVETGQRRGDVVLIVGDGAAA